MKRKYERIYIKIAKRHGIPVGEVLHEMQNAINLAYIHPSSRAQNIADSRIPTTDEVIEYIVNETKDKK